MRKWVNILFLIFLNLNLVLLGTGLVFVVLDNYNPNMGFLQKALDGGGLYLWVAIVLALLVLWALKHNLVSEK